MGLDFVFLMRDGTENTFSAAIYSFSKDFPVVVFFFGMIAGHLLWPMAKDTMNGPKD